MMNSGYKNPNDFAPVECDLMDKLIVIKEDVLSRDIKANEVWNKRYAHFYALAKNSMMENRVVEALASFLYQVGAIKDDVYISYYNMEFLETDPDVSNFEQALKAGEIPFGFSKYNKISHTPLIGFTVTSNYSEVRLFKVMYYDGSSVRIFTPYSGNPVNVVTGTALGDEVSSGIKESTAGKYIESEACKDIFGESFAAKDLVSQEICGNKYLEHFHIEAVRMQNGLFAGAKVPIDFCMIADELKQNLNSQKVTD